MRSLRYYWLPIHVTLCYPAARLHDDCLGAVGFGKISSSDVGPDYAGRLRGIHVQTLREVGRMIRSGVAKSLGVPEARK